MQGKQSGKQVSEVQSSNTRNNISKKIKIKGHSTKISQVKCPGEAWLFGAKKAKHEEARNEHQQARHKGEGVLPPSRKPKILACPPLVDKASATKPSQGRSPELPPDFSTPMVKPAPIYVPQWRVKENDRSVNKKVARELVHGLPTPADRQAVAELSSETLELTLCKNLAQEITILSELSHRMTTSSSRVLDLNSQLSQQGEILKAKEDELVRLKAELEQLNAKISSLERSLAFAHVDFIWLKGTNEDLKAQLADPTSLPVVKDYLREAWKRGYNRHKAEVARALPELDLSVVRSVEEVIAEIQQEAAEAETT